MTSAQKTERRKLRQLEEENAQLKKLVGDLSLDLSMSLQAQKQVVHRRSIQRKNSRSP